MCTHVVEMLILSLVCNVAGLATGSVAAVQLDSQDSGGSRLSDHQPGATAVDTLGIVDSRFYQNSIRISSNSTQTVFNAPFERLGKIHDVVWQWGAQAATGAKP